MYMYTGAHDRRNIMCTGAHNRRNIMCTGAHDRGKERRKDHPFPIHTCTIGTYIHT